MLCVGSAEEDSAELDRLRRLLCIPKADVQQLHKDIFGRIYQEVCFPLAF